MVDVPPQNLAKRFCTKWWLCKIHQIYAGMHVNKGETLAILEDPQIVQLQQDYLLAKSNLNYAQKDYSDKTTSIKAKPVQIK